MVISNKRRIAFLNWVEHQLLETPHSPLKDIRLKINRDFITLQEELVERDMTISDLILLMKRTREQPQPKQQTLF